MAMTSEGYRVAVVGATGIVGQTVLLVLEQRCFPVRELVPFASERSKDHPVTFQGQELQCQVLDAATVEGFDFTIFAAGGSVSQEWAPRFASTGALVIDKSSAWRDKSDVPLVVAGVNDDALKDALIDGNRNIIASPNCSTIQLVVALKPILDEVGLEEIVIATYQSVSGTGRSAMDELENQAHALLHGERSSSEVYPHQIAFNVLPHVEDFDADGSGYAGEELKLMNETRKILGKSESDLAISATCVRVPVFKAHSEAVRIRTREPLSADDCRELLRRTNGIVVVDDPQRSQYPLAIDAADKDEVFVGRIRNDLGPNAARCLNMWIVGDNLRKGAATNAVQIAEELSRRGLLRIPRQPQPVGAAN
jgi:aspartate-semialdehyde dehydrogenase